MLNQTEITFYVMNKLGGMNNLATKCSRTFVGMFVHNLELFSGTKKIYWRWQRGTCVAHPASHTSVKFWAINTYVQSPKKAVRMYKEEELRIEFFSVFSLRSERAAQEPIFFGIINHLLLIYFNNLDKSLHTRRMKTSEPIFLNKLNRHSLFAFECVIYFCLQKIYRAN